MNLSLRPTRSGLVCGIGAVAFTLMSFLVQLGKLPRQVFLSGILLFIGLAVAGFVRKKDKKAFFSASVMGGAALLGFAVISLTQPMPLEEKVWLKVGLAVAAALIFWVLLAGFRLWLQSFHGLRGKGSPPVLSAVTVAVYTIAALCLSWLKWYPSGTSPDTRHQWGQIHGDLILNDVHALGHTIFLKGLLAIWDSYAMVILVHILMIALLYGLFAHYLAGKGIRLGWMLLAVSLFTACETPTSTYMYPWKDTPYTFAVGMLTLFIVYLIDERVKFTVGKAVLMAVALAYTTLFRLNGIVILLFMGIWLLCWLIRRKLWKHLIAMAAAVAICFGAVNWIGYEVLKAESPENGFSIQVFGSGIAAMTVYGGPTDMYDDKEPMDPADREAIARVLDPIWMIEQYQPWQTRNIIWTYETNDREGIFDDPNMEIMVNNFVLDLGRNKWDVVKLYLKLMPKYFGICVRDILYNTFAVWGFVPEWNHDCAWYYSNIFLLVLMMVGVGANWKKASIGKRLIVFAPVICNAVSIAISTITNETRYLLPTHTLFPVLMLYLICMSDRLIPDTIPDTEPDAIPEKEE